MIQETQKIIQVFNIQCNHCGCKDHYSLSEETTRASALVAGWVIPNANTHLCPNSLKDLYREYMLNRKMDVEQSDR